ncbi:MAG: hypothetical protein QM656_03370 [Paracoccaceae bacterium]
MTRLISAIYNRANGNPLTGRAAEERNAEVFRRMWRERGLLVIDPATVHDEWVRQAVINIAEERYGRGR